MSCDKSQDYGDVVNDCIGIKTNNEIYLVQDGGCSEYLFFWQTKKPWRKWKWKSLRSHVLRFSLELAIQHSRATCERQLVCHDADQHGMKKDHVWKIRYFKLSKRNVWFFWRRCKSIICLCVKISSLIVFDLKIQKSRKPISYILLRIKLFLYY